MIKKSHVLYLTIVLLSALGCDNEPYEGGIFLNDDLCQIAIDATADSAFNFTLADENNFSLLCQAYKNALTDQIDICGDENGTLLATVQSLGNCSSNPIDLCEDAITASQIAQSNYDNASSANFEILCNEYVNALTNQILFCGDPNGELQEIRDELGECSENDLFPIAGVWILTFILVDDPIDLDNDEVETINIYNEMDCYPDDTFTFYENGTGEFYRISTATYSYISNTQSSDGVEFSVLCTDVENSTRAFNWELVENDLTITFTDNQETLLFFKSTYTISLLIDNGFSAINSTTNSSPITQDIAFGYVKS